MSKRREKARDAAVECCKALRKYIADNGDFRDVWPHLDRWMRLETNQKYDDPKPTSPIWCFYCKKRHIAGKCETPESKS